MRSARGRGHILQVWMPLALAVWCSACGNDLVETPPAGTEDVAAASDAALGADATPEDVQADTADGVDTQIAPDVADTADLDAVPVDTYLVDTHPGDPDSGDTAAPDAAGPDGAGEDTAAADAGLEDATPTDVSSADASADSDISADVDGGTSPTGPTACDGAHPCASGVCDPASHVCVACVTTFDCATGQTCSGNACVAATWCISDIACKATQQVCDVSAGACVDCLTAADCGPDQACTQHKCVAAPPCKSSKDCDAVCDQAAGVCVGCLKDTDCLAGEFCAANHTCKADLCTAPVCVGGQAFSCLANGSGFQPATVCTDANLCTDDACADGLGCTFTNNVAACDDLSACTTADTCAAGTCGGTAVVCDDQNACTTDTCDPASGCLFTASTGPCDDAQPCTTQDTCALGLCAGVTASCDDGSACTVDSCDLALGCTYTAAGAVPCNDGDACTLIDTCADGSCVSGAGLACDDGDICTTDSCTPDAGCLHTPASGVPCDDGNVCTDVDTCVSGTCAGVAVLCDDQNPCTDDVCDLGSGCTHTDSLLACDDGNPCTDDGCQPATGCIWTGNSAACEDGNPCTTGDNCHLGKCLSGTAFNCDDANACTTDACGPSGCLHAAVVDGLSCGGSDGCTGDMCIQGACVANKPILWEKQVTTSASEQFYATARTTDGDVALVGGQTAEGQSVQGWVVRLDPSGGQLWSKKAGGSGEDRFYAVTADADGAITAAGTRTTTNAGQDGWIVRWDAGGGVISEKTLGGNGTDSLRAIAPVSTGGWILAGTQTVAQGPLGSSTDGWILRLDAAGNTVFSKTFGSATWTDGLYGVVENSDGTFTAVGTQWVGNTVATGWFLRVDATGTAIASTTYAPGLSQELRGITAMPGGGYALAGWVTPLTGGTSAWLHFVDANGIETSRRTWHKGNVSYLYGISAIPSGGFLVSGQYQNGGGSPTAWFLRTDTAGNVQWSNSWGGSNTDAAQAVQVWPDNTAIVAGYWGATGSNYDGFVRRIDLFGNASCVNSGDCVQKPADGCDDGNPCTFDTCAAGVCGHTDVSDDTVCGANATCQDGVCTAN